MASAVGQPIQSLDTPALLLDYQALTRNLKLLADYFSNRPCKLRPHFKNHKCTTLAKLQLETGSAVGITCAKLSEAEILAANGIDDILIANQIVGKQKIKRLIDLARHANIRVAVDHINQITAISQAASKTSVEIGLLVEINIGMNRCGVTPGSCSPNASGNTPTPTSEGAPALQLAKAIIDLPGVCFDGLQAYEGHCAFIDDPEEKTKQTRKAIQLALDTRTLIEASSIPVPILSGGSSSTYKITGSPTSGGTSGGGYNEIQAGTYPTMDWRYKQAAPEFEIALSILTTIISTPAPNIAVLDIGTKGIGHEFGPPQIKDHPTATIKRFAPEEHTIIKTPGTTPTFGGAPSGGGGGGGQTIQLIPSHSCTTCNLHCQFHVHENGKVIAVWPIEAAGALT